MRLTERRSKNGGHHVTKRALITGVTGQDGSYLAELLLSKGYEVHGMIRRASTFNTQRIDHIFQDPHTPDRRLFLSYGDLVNSEQLPGLIYNVKPDEIYHLAAQSQVKVSFQMPEYTGAVTGLGTTRLLEAIRHSGIKTRFYHSASSEMFGSSPPPQHERTPFRPCNPYAAAKAYAFWLTTIYREGYKLFTCNGILFNHESPRRGETFITRKISRGISHILSGKQDKLYVGNLNAKRDWGYAPEYVEAMWRMLQQDHPEDYVIGTGEAHTVQEFIEAAFAYVDLDWRRHVVVDPRYFRPVETPELVADAGKARRALGWSPRIKFRELVQIMVDADMEAMGLQAPGEGKRLLIEKFGAWHQWQGAVQDVLSGLQREVP